MCVATGFYSTDPHFYTKLMLCPPPPLRVYFLPLCTVRIGIESIHYYVVTRANNFRLLTPEEVVLAKLAHGALRPLNLKCHQIVRLGPAGSEIS